MNHKCYKFSHIVFLLFFGLIIDTSTSFASERFPDKLELLHLLQKQEYSQLNDTLMSYQSLYESGRTNERVVAFSFSIFSNVDPALEERLSSWIEKFPKSYAAYMARGIYYYSVGYEYRGFRFISDTKGKQINKMRKYMDKGFKDLIKASSLTKKSTLAYSYMIDLTRTSGPKQMVKRLLKKGLSINPASYSVRMSYLNSLQPKWGGTLAEIGAFLHDTESYVYKNPRLKSLLGYLDYTKADIFKLDKRRDKAAEYYDKALRYGANSLYLYRRGVNHYFLENYQAALKDFNRVLEIWPQHDESLSWRSSIYKKRKMLYKAFDDIELALKLDSHNSQYLKNRGYILRALKKPHEANKDFIASTYYNPYSAGTWSAIGWYYQYEVKEYQKSVDAYSKAVKLSPKKAKYWYFYAGALNNVFACDKLDEALNKYLALCRKRKQTYCKSENTGWAENSLQLLRKGNTHCKKSSWF